MFEASVSGSPMTFVYALILGVVLGAVYDVFRMVRIARGNQTHSKHSAFVQNRSAYRIRTLPLWKKRQTNGKPEKKKRSLHIVYGLDRTLTFLEDILFGVVFALAVELFLFDTNFGVIRWYLLFGTAVGFFVYYFTIGRLVMAVATRILALLRFAVKLLYNHTIFYLLFLVSTAMYQIYRLLRFIVEKLLRRRKDKRQKRSTVHRLSDLYKQMDRIGIV